jgi:hypothetical protein
MALANKIRDPVAWYIFRTKKQKIPSKTHQQTYLLACWPGIKVNVPVERINMLVGTLEFNSDKVKDNHVKFGPT